MGKSQTAGTLLGTTNSPGTDEVPLKAWVGCPFFVPLPVEREMKALDRLLQQWRIQKVRPYLSAGMRVLDIGCADAALFRQVPGLGEYVGIDPGIERTQGGDRGPLVIKGYFPRDLPDARPFDVIALLAVLEHIPSDQQARLAEDCARFLIPGGYLLITVPSPLVDYLLATLKFLCLIDGMSLEEHHGFEVRRTPALFASGDWNLVAHSSFQLGLNNLFVFRKRLAPSANR
jgi:SAM-dependent methyltransferase